MVERFGVRAVDGFELPMTPARQSILKQHQIVAEPAAPRQRIKPPAVSTRAPLMMPPAA